MFKTMRFAFAVILLSSVLGWSQVPRPKFEVASIKPTTGFGPINTTPERFVAAASTIRGLITYAYRLRDYQILGGPGWVGSDRWEIQAKNPEGTVISRPASMEELEQSLTKPDKISLMLQSLLEERFHLKAHRETRELPIYELTVAKGGPKIVLADDQSPIVFAPLAPGQSPFQRLPDGRPMITRGGYSIGGSASERRFEAKAMSISRLITALLINETGRHVSDKTNLTGLYDLKMQWAQANLQASPDLATAFPVLTTAIQEQLGLKLEPARGPVEVFVIDSVERPSEN